MSEEFIPTTTNRPAPRTPGSAVPTTTNKPAPQRAQFAFGDFAPSEAQAVNIPNESGILTPAPGEPITLERAKVHLHVVISDEDDYISDLIVAARQMAEGRLNRTLVQRQMVATFRSWCDTMRLLKPPIVSVDSVDYTDVDGVLQSFADFDLIGAAVTATYGTEVPALRYRPDAIRVTYTAGYAEGEVPRPIISWMLLVIGALYAHRESMTAGVKVEMIPEEFNRWLLQPYMVYE